MITKETLDFLSSLLKFILAVIPIGAILFGLLNRGNSVMNAKKESLIRILRNIINYIVTTLIIALLTVITLLDYIIKVDISNLNGYDIRSIKFIFMMLLIYSAFYALVLSPIWLRNKKYYEIELEHSPGVINKYRVINRIKEKDEDSIIYRDKKGYEYEENVELIKEREGRITLKPKIEPLFNINDEVKEITKKLNMPARIICYLIFIVPCIYLFYTCIIFIKGIFSGIEGFIVFKLISSGLPVLIILYTVIAIIGLAIYWFSKNKIEYIGFLKSEEEANN